MDWKKKLDWITYIVNMLAALPFLGLISAIASGLFLDAINCGVRPEWDFWVCFFWIFLILTVLWGRYQYRLLILKNPRHPRVTWKSLLFLGGFVLVVTLLPFCFKLIKMKRISEDARQRWELRNKQIAAEWEALIGQEGCLISAADIRFSIEGSIFAKEDWQAFFASARKQEERFLYIIQQFSSRRPTRIHICNFRYATEGEVAVFAAQQIVRKNWYEYDGPEERIKEIARTDTAAGKALLVKEVLEDEALCTALQEYFRQSAPR